MRVLKTHSPLLLAMLLACGGDEPAEGESAPPGMSALPWAGGRTSDFTGSCAWCMAPEFEELALDDDSSPLGFSPQEVLDYVTGVHAGDVRWHDPCAPSECAEFDEGCPRDPPSFAGTTTELRVEVQHGGGATLELCPGADRESYCPGMLLHLPLEVTLRTSDGVLEAYVEHELLVSPGSHVEMGGLLYASALRGSLPEALPDASLVDWTVWFGERGTGADLFVLGAVPAGERHGDNLMQLRAAGEDRCTGGFDLPRRE